MDRQFLTPEDNHKLSKNLKRCAHFNRIFRNSIRLVGTACWGEIRFRETILDFFEKTKETDCTAVIGNSPTTLITLNSATGNYENFLMTLSGFEFECKCKAKADAYLKNYLESIEDFKKEVEVFEQEMILLDVQRLFGENDN